jgi:hypothetical protein
MVYGSIDRLSSRSMGQYAGGIEMKIHPGDMKNASFDLSYS